MPHFSLWVTLEMCVQWRAQGRAKSLFGQVPSDKRQNNDSVFSFSASKYAKENLSFEWIYMKGHKDFVFINNDFGKWQQDMLITLENHNQKNE